MNEEAGVIQIYNTALYAAIGLMTIFEHERSVKGLMVLVLIGLVLIVNFL